MLPVEWVASNFLGYVICTTKNIKQIYVIVVVYTMRIYQGFVHISVWHPHVGLSVRVSFCLSVYSHVCLKATFVGKGDLPNINDNMQLS